MWVHATLIDATIAVNDAWLGPVDRARQAIFYAETRPIGRAFGIPDAMLPADLEAFEAYVASMLAPGGSVQVGPLARDLATTILHPPLPAGLGSLPIPTGWYDWTLWPAIGLLPPRIRDAYGFPWDARHRIVAAWLVAGWRTWRPWLPASFRQMPQALAADRRLARRLGEGPATDGGSRA